MLRTALMTGLLFAAMPAMATTALLGGFALDVPARGFEEHCVKLGAGERVRYRFRASDEVDFNIHFHRDKDVLYPVRASASRGVDAVFAAPGADVYCLMWERKGDGAVRVEGSVDRATP
jgi:hypothetical protein